MVRVTKAGSRIVAAAAMIAALAAGTALAEDGKFDLVLKGITAGSLTFSGDVDGGSYAVKGRLKTGGLAALLKKVRYDATASGSYSDGRFRPASYSESADTGKRQSESLMSWKGNVPQVRSYDPPRQPRDWDVDPATQAGAVDPLTAMFATLRDVEPGQECKISLRMFDGRRATQIATSAPKAAGETVVCSGEYRRLAGFSPEDMAEKTRFPFTLTYAPNGAGKMRVTEVAMDTLFGKARLVRD